MSQKKVMTGKFGAIYRIYHRRKLIAIVTDFDEGFIDHVRDLNAEIKVKKVE